MLKQDPTQRFSDRVADYVQYRPGYPAETLDVLCAAVPAAPPWVVADVGSGTGIFSRLLLEAGHRVFSVEPNQAMREAGERELHGYSGFASVAGTSEATGLAGTSVQLVVAAQAFHWFDPHAARCEFQRILTTDGRVALIWNTRTLRSDFARAYEAFLEQFGTDYQQVGRRHRNCEAGFPEFFGPRGYQRSVLPNEQRLTREGVRGRLLSSSYIPNSGPRREEMLHALDVLFDAHAVDGIVTIEYDTEIYTGPIS